MEFRLSLSERRPMGIEVEENRVASLGDLLVISLDLNELKTKSLEFRLERGLLRRALGR